MVLCHSWIPSFLQEVFYNSGLLTLNTISGNLTWDNHRAGRARVQS
ncbi:LOW QUALITY PROTEIN: hypothetical protein TorRG33x02_333280 [Trema orientale]|uniref:Uncharacterized protein n=1 Tax=Trema orientale TaxID=63057 RepID=A0A2P5B4B9_TREOI|nr:LOW QUALITY PROTEIN: hypothetical protein TorRG33x02_333280 [Trema orientale]